MKNLLLFLVIAAVALGAAYLLTANTTHYTSPEFEFADADTAATIQYNDDASKALLTIGDKTYELNRQESGSGTAYQSEDGSVLFREHQGNFVVEIDGEVVIDTEADAANNGALTVFEDTNNNVFSILYNTQEDAMVFYNNQEYSVQRAETASGVTMESADGSVVFTEHQGEASLTIDGTAVVENATQVPFDDVLEFNVAAERQTCDAGAGERECLVVNNELFYDDIEGFNPQEGTSYTIFVIRNEREDVPADASAYTYQLVTIFSQEPPATAASADNSLAGTSWTWVQTTGIDDTVTTPTQTDAFVLTFADDGRFSATTDCNNIAGAYTATNDTLAFSEMASTRKACLGDSQETIFTNQLSTVHSYVIVDDELVLTTEDGNMEFVPATTEE